MIGKIIKLKNGTDEFKILDKIIVNSDTSYLIENVETKVIMIVKPFAIDEIKD